MDEWVDGGMDVWMYGCIVSIVSMYVCMYRCVYVWMDGRKDG